MGIFSKKTWLPRIVPYPNRRRLIPVDSGIYDVVRADGTPTQEGDFFSDVNMNGLESRIEDAINEVDNIKIDKASISNNFATTDWSQVAAAPLVKELKDEINMASDIVDYTEKTVCTNCTCTNFYYVKYGSIVHMRAAFVTTIATPSSYSIRFTLPYQPMIANTYATMADGGEVNDVVMYDTISNKQATINISGTHASGYAFYVSGFFFTYE